MSEIDQRERADSYHREMIAMLAGETARYTSYAAKNGHDDLVAADHRQRVRTLLATITTIEAGQFHHSSCEACGKPLVNGQQVISYGDVGEVHADCDYPQFASEDPPSHEFDDSFGPDRCRAILDRAQALLAEIDVEEGTQGDA